MKFVLSPVLSAWKSFLGGEGARKKIVLLVDEILAAPLEALNFADAAAVSRDFSMHILLRRLPTRHLGAMCPSVG